MVAMVAVGMPAAHGARLNDKELNRPYADNRRWNLGFGSGLTTFDLTFHHNDFVTDDGRKWFAEQPSFSPGFAVNGLFNLRLNNYFSVRVTPGMLFGNRVVKFIDKATGEATGEEQKQDIKSAYLVLPVDIKFASQRMRNIRPYMIAGVMPSVDVLKKKSDYLKLKSSDFMLSVGFGCDIYLPYFKLMPELKFCFGLSDVLQHDRPDLVDDPERLNVSNSFKKATTKMVVLTFYFE